MFSRNIMANQKQRSGLTRPTTELTKWMREHNPKTLIFQNKLGGFTGVSGGNVNLPPGIRYHLQRIISVVMMESFGAYAGQFIGDGKADVDKISVPFSPISIEQRPQCQTQCSTVGTVTEVYDFPPPPGLPEQRKHAP